MRPTLKFRHIARFRMLSIAFRPFSTMVELNVLLLTLTSSASGASPPADKLTALLDHDQPCVPNAHAASRLCAVPSSRLSLAPAGTRWHVFAKHTSPHAYLPSNTYPRRVRYVFAVETEAESKKTLGDAPISESSINLFPGKIIHSHLFGKKRAYLDRVLTCEVAKAAGDTARLAMYDATAESYEMLGSGAMHFACAGLFRTNALVTMSTMLSEEFLLAAFTPHQCAPAPAPTSPQSQPLLAPPSDLDWGAYSTMPVCFFAGKGNVYPLLITLVSPLERSFDTDAGILGPVVEGLVCRRLSCARRLCRVGVVCVLAP